MQVSFTADRFLKDLQESIVATQVKNIRPVSKKYKPSNLHCIRNMFFQMTGQEPDKDVPIYYMPMISGAGTDAHARIQKAVSAMRENGFDCDYLDVGEFVRNQQEKGLCQDIVIGEQQGNETHLYNTKYNISFLCDGIIKYKGEYYIIEFKTEGTKKWQARKDVNPDHINQAATYSLCLNLSNVLFVYINRDYFAMKAYMLEVTDTMRERIISKIEECNLYVEKNEIPPVPEGMKAKDCAYCQYKSFCKSLQDDNKTTEPPAEETKLEPLVEDTNTNLPPLPF